MENIAGSKVKNSTTSKLPNDSLAVVALPSVVEKTAERADEKRNGTVVVGDKQVASTSTDTEHVNKVNIHVNEATFSPDAPSILEKSGKIVGLDYLPLDNGNSTLSDNKLNGTQLIGANGVADAVTKYQGGVTKQQTLYQCKRQPTSSQQHRNTG